MDGPISVFSRNRFFNHLIVLLGRFNQLHHFDFFLAFLLVWVDFSLGPFGFLFSHGFFDVVDLLQDFIEVVGALVLFVHL